MNHVFKTNVYQNQFLAEGADQVHAILSTESHGPAVDAGTPLVFGLLIDCSGSMSENGGHRIRCAKAAVAKAITVVRDDAFFFVIAGTESAQTVVPLTQSSLQSRKAACEAVMHLQASGGTKMSRWFEAALLEFKRKPDAIRCALMLTDGKNEPADRLEPILEKCAGSFQCDARGVGTDWQTEQLRKISSHLLGTVDIVPEAVGLEADFKAILEKAQGKSVSEAVIRLWTPIGATVEFVKQVAPDMADLTAKGWVDPTSPQIRNYPTGSWGKESRDHHFCIRVKPGEVGQKMLAGRVSLVVKERGAESKVAESQILAIWTDDEAKSAVLNRQVAHYTGQGELAQAIQDGLEARREGDTEKATARLGRAVQLAAESGHDETTRLLRKVVDVVDEREGTVRLKRQISEADAMALDTRSTRTRRA